MQTTVTIGQSEIIKKQSLKVNGVVFPRLELFQFDDGSYLLSTDGNLAKGLKGSFQEIQKALPLIFQIMMPGGEVDIETGGLHPQASEYSTGPTDKALDDLGFGLVLDVEKFRKDVLS